MKRITAVFLALVLLLLCAVFAGAEENITVRINGTAIDFDVPPQIIRDRTMVPMRGIFESLGAKVEWNAEMRMVLATYCTSVIAMCIDAENFSVTDVLTGETKSFALDVPAQIVQDRTLIPLRAVSEALGKTVDWDGETRTVSITD